MTKEKEVLVQDREGVGEPEVGDNENGPESISIFYHHCKVQLLIKVFHHFFLKT